MITESLVAIFVLALILAFALHRREHLDKRNANQQSQSHGDSGSRGFTVSQPGRGEASSEAEWLDGLVERLWPRISEYIQILLVEKIAPAINAALPAIARGSVNVTEFSLGKAAPKFGSLTLRERERGTLVLDIDMDLESDIAVTIHAVGVPVGIQKIAFSGTLSVVMQPPTDRPPFFGGIEIYFANPPDLRLDFTGALNVADCPGLSGKIRSAIQGVINRMVVTPNRKAVDMDVHDEVDKLDLQYPNPLGILRFTLLKGSGLRGMDSHFFGKNTSDPYVVVKIGQEVWTSPTISRSCDPTWTEDNVVDMPIYEQEQRLSLAAYDSDWLGGDDLLGTSSLVAAEDFMDSVNRLKSGDAPLTYQGAAAGSLRYSAQWLTFAQTPEEGIGGPSQIHLTAKIHDAKGLPQRGNAPYTVLVRYEASRLDRSIEMRTLPSQRNPGHSEAMADELRAVVLNLNKRNMSNDDISAITTLPAQEIHQVIQLENDPIKAQVHMRQAIQTRTSTHPHFETVLSFLAPWNAEMADAKVALQLRNKNDVRVCEIAGISISELAAMKECTHVGPFDLGKGAQIRAKLELRFMRTS